jgi:hypothetical protein
MKRAIYAAVFQWFWRCFVKKSLREEGEAMKHDMRVCRGTSIDGGDFEGV